VARSTQFQSAFRSNLRRQRRCLLPAHFYSTGHATFGKGLLETRL